eukprot:TRINITY_DN23240_c0_g1_i11.p1 TRINITY_DN23240_c0_g1~~TRINITY_DN23240_c0_g1_i11.p1  ORF type:complete len:559 (+),score=169.92 TRINITY_DN23240_c0_g1_i11:25-1701(+)
MSNNEESENGTKKTKAQEEFSRVKMSTTGLGAMFGMIQQNREKLQEETKPDPDAPSIDIPLEKLCDTGHGLPKSFRSQRVSIWFCETCEVDLNSEVTYNTHISGAKHKKKEKNKQMIEERKRLGEPIKEEPKQPKAKKAKKGVIDFRELVRDSNDPVIGLQHVVEIFPSEHSGDNDAMYSCNLCYCDSTAASMFAHVKGHKHREKYLSMKYNIVTDDKARVVQEAKRVEKNEGRRLAEVDTIFDDEKYPWPPGKKPAHLEAKDKNCSDDDGDSNDNLRLSEDGTMSREFARRGYNFDRHKEADNRVKLTNSTVAQVLKSLQASSVKDEDDAEMAHQVAAHLMRALTEYKMLHGDPRESSIIKMKSNEILKLLNEVREVVSVSHDRTPSASYDNWSGGGNIVDYGHGQSGGSGGNDIMTKEEEKYMRYLSRMSAERKTASSLDSMRVDNSGGSYNSGMRTMGGGGINSNNGSRNYYGMSGGDDFRRRMMNDGNGMIGGGGRGGGSGNYNDGGGPMRGGSGFTNMAPSRPNQNRGFSATMPQQSSRDASEFTPLFGKRIM